VELVDMQISGLSAKALAAEQIEGEALHPQSMRASATRRLRLALATEPKKITIKPVRKNFKLDHRAPAREESTPDVLQAAVCCCACAYA
jgi:hypothetical protein